MSQINQTSLWMGDVDGTMSESDILEAFATVGEPAIGVRFIRDKVTHLPQPYCFVHFRNIESAQRAMRKVNGKRIPKFLHKTFKLNLAQFGKEAGTKGQDYSLYVGNLSPEVDEGMMMTFFSSRFKAVKEVKVVKGADNNSRGFGFVRFFNEDDQENAVKILHGSKGLGQRPIILNKAVPKPKEYMHMKAGIQDYSYQQDYYNYYYQYHQQQYNAWTNYQAQDGQRYSYQNEEQLQQYYAQQAIKQSQENDDEQLVEHTIPCDVEALNKECMENNDAFYQALEASRWQFVDTMQTTIQEACKT